MSEFFLFTRPRFTARTVACVIGHRLGRRLTYQEPDDLEDLDGAVDITARVSCTGRSRLFGGLCLGKPKRDEKLAAG